MIPGLKYRNPELNKNRQKLNYTPIPIYSNSSNMNEYQKNELKKAIDKAVFIRKTEYTHAFPPPISEQDKNQQYKTISMLQLINSAKIIQKWYRKIKNNKEIKNINKNNKLKNLNEKKKIDEKEVYDYWKKVYKFDIDNEPINKKYQKNNEYYDYWETIYKKNNIQNKKEDLLKNKNNNQENTNNSTQNKNIIQIINNNDTKNIIDDKPIITKNIQNIDNDIQNNIKDLNNINNISNEISININNKNKIKIFDNTKTQYDDLAQINILSEPKKYVFQPENNLTLNYSGDNMNNSNKNQIFKELYQENNNNFKIVDDNENYIQSNNLDIQFKPIINCCYLTKDKIMLLNNSDDMNKIKIIQNKTKIFLKNKNKINNNININNTNESLNENISSIKDSLNINNFNNDNNYKKSLNTSLKTLSNYNNIDNNKTQNNSDDDIKNYSENKSHTRKRIISKLDSLQSIHNLTINKDGVQFFDNIIGNYDDSSSSIKENINNNNISISKNNSINNSKISMSLTNSINNIEKNINLRNKNRNKDNLLFIEKKYI